jgi:ubiquitin-protein ligase
MTARQRRLASDYEDIKKNFTGHKNIVVTPIGDDEIPEAYHVTYFVNGIYLLPDGRIETLGRHEVEITLHAEYPRYKPLCKILTPIWHPNFRDGQICIGDIWGAGEYCLSGTGFNTPQCFSKQKLVWFFVISSFF